MAGPPDGLALMVLIDNDWLKLGKFAQNVEHVQPLGKFANSAKFAFTRANLVRRFQQICGRKLLV